MSDLVFGPIVDGHEVEKALISHLRAWMPTQVAAARRIKDPDEELWPHGVAAVRSYTVVHQANEKWPEDQLPMLLVFSPGLGAPPRVEGDGTYSGRFQAIVTAIASGANMPDTKALARLYASAARLAILQHPSISGFANDDGAAWLDHQNFQVTRGVEAERNLMGVSDTYLIGVDAMLNRDAGLLEPQADPEEIPEDRPIVETSSADVVLRTS